MAHQAIRRCVVATAAAGLALIGQSGAAHAATPNTPPSQPLLSELSTGTKACAAGDQRPYVSSRPRLSAVLRDPDATGAVSVRLNAEFEASWTDADDQLQTRTYSSGTALTSGSTFTWTTPSDLPADTVVSWRVRATDGTDRSPWSSDDGRGQCEFVYDDTSPGKPSVSSADYPDDDTWHEGVGRYGSFTFVSPSADVVAYRYSFTGETEKTVAAPGPGEPVTVRWMPERHAPYYLDVQSVDRSGRLSSPTTYRLWVTGGRTPVGYWKLADAAGSAGASDAGSGSRPAAAGSGVTFGVSGPTRTGLGSAAGFDGSADAELTTGEPVADTSKTFVISAWARPDSVGQDLTAVSQGAVSLGLDDGAWSFTLGDVRVSGGSPSAGEWAHLVGVYDAELNTARLYVNGTSAGTAGAAPAASGDPLRIGGAADGGSNWHGRLADIRVWDRVVVSAEVTELAAHTPARRGYWQLNSASDGTSPELGGGLPLTLAGDASIHTSESTCDILEDPDCVPTGDPITGTGDLQLDGDGDYASTTDPVVDTDDSFTVTAQVRLDDPDATRDMAVLSVPGEHTNAFVVRYEAATHSWELVMSHSDSADAEVTAVRAYANPGDTSGVQALAVVYDDSADQIRLYVDRQLLSTTQVTLASSDTWKATGGLQVGRALTADGWGEYLDGRIDEVRAYAGALGATAIVQVGAGGELPDM